MKIITATQQGEALIRLSKLNDALMSEDAISGTYRDDIENYCPNCGADMRGDTE